jgi:hypothetical protein
LQLSQDIEIQSEPSYQKLTSALTSYAARI